ncbi:hypothetical protein B5S32_g1294 [[Candida] boidinii]|nr:hypothetical protein B5S32_g1294 [[Candida] boidinii]
MNHDLFDISYESARCGMRFGFTALNELQEKIDIVCQNFMNIADEAFEFLLKVESFNKYEQAEFHNEYIKKISKKLYDIFEYMENIEFSFTFEEVEELFKTIDSVYNDFPELLKLRLFENINYLKMTILQFRNISYENKYKYANMINETISTRYEQNPYKLEFTFQPKQDVYFPYGNAISSDYLKFESVYKYNDKKGIEKDNDIFMKEEEFIDYINNISIDEEINSSKDYESITEEEEYLLPPPKTVLASAVVSDSDGIPDTFGKHQSEITGLFYSGAESILNENEKISNIIFTSHESYDSCMREFYYRKLNKIYLKPVNLHRRYTRHI